MNSYIEDATLHVPESSITAYQVAEPWKQFKIIVAIDENNGITHISDNCTYLWWMVYFYIRWRSVCPAPVPLYLLLEALKV